MWAIAKKEIQQYLSSFTGYLIISFYLLVNGLLLFVLPNYNILDFGYASLQVYFDFAPWLLIFLVPAVTMRSFSEEYQQGTYEILRTLPLQPLQLMIGKFLGAVCILLAAIAPTFLYAVVLQLLSSTGGIDIGATIGSYIGLLFLAMVYVAIGILVSSATKNNLIALLISILVCLFLLKGFDSISQFSFFANGLGFYVKQLGLQVHFQNMSKGLVALKDVIYFLSIIVLFAMGTIEYIQGKIKYGIFLFLIIGFNYAVHLFPIQWDLTKEKRYTLSETSKQIISQIELPVKVHLYLGGDLPAQYKKLAISTIAMLDQLSQLNPAQIQWQWEVPNELYKDTALYQMYDSLAKLGLPIERIQKNDKQDKRVDQLIIPGALVEVNGQKPYAIDLRSAQKYYKPYNIVKDIPEIDEEASFNAAEALLEYKIVQAIYLLNRQSIPRIAYLIGNGEPVDLTVNDIGESIRHQYDLSVFDLSKGYPDARKIKTLLIVKPTQPFSDMDKLKIDQFVMGGGNIIWAIDPLHAEYDSLQKTDGSYVAYDRGLGLGDLFFKMGVRINLNLVQDLNCAKIPMVVGTQANGSPLIQRLPWAYYPFLQGNNQHVLTQNLDRVLSLFPSSIDTVFARGIQKRILLSSDTNTRTISSPSLISLNSVKGEEDMLQFHQHHLPIAVLLEGKFISLFSNRMSQAMLDSVSSQSGVPFASQSKGSKQVVIADADIFTNKVDKNKGPLAMGMLPMEEYRFANREFFQNTIQYLNEPVGLLDSRNKSIVLRLLDSQKVQEARLFWQLILLIGPLVVLALLYGIGVRVRKRRFGA
jgi:ABC-2 type transport system permease protein